MGTTTEVTTDGPRLVRAFELLRPRYEYGHESIENMCVEEGYQIHQLQKYAEAHNWTRVEDPDFSDPEAVDKFYSRARAALTVQVARRALWLWPSLVKIEDATLQVALEALDNLDTASTNIDVAGQISKLSKVVSSLVSSSGMLTQAVNAPAIKDTGILDTLKTIEPASVSEAERILKERGIPIPDSGLDIPDVKPLEDI